jgi:hypothetical protein
VGIIRSAKGAKASTTKNQGAADLYERLLTIQHGANLQWPETDLANAGIRDQFRLNQFPPAGGNGPPPIPPTPPVTTPKP